MILHRAQERETITKLRNYSHKNNNETIIRSNNQKKVITIWKKFFNYSLNQSYSIDENKTKYDFFMNIKTPKWMLKQLNLVSPTMSATSAYQFDHIVFYEYDKNYIFSIEVFNPWEHTVNLMTQEEGLALLGSYEMINQKFEIMKNYKRFIQAFKVMNAEEIKGLISQVTKDESVRLLSGSRFSDRSLEDGILININNLV